MYVCMRMCNGSKFVLNNASYFVYLYAKALNTYASMYVYVYITLAVWQLNTYIDI